MNYEFKSTPFPHQLAEFEQHRDDIHRALFLEMGLGKSKCAIDKIGYLYEQKKADAGIVVAPSGVHRNWTDSEFPAHLPDRIKRYLVAYNTNKAGTLAHQESLTKLVTFEGLSILSIGYDALLTDKGKRAAWDLLKSRRCVYVVDEGRRIKNPDAKRTKVVVESGQYAPYRILLNGTPISQGPFDLYPQFLFLNKDFWKPLGISNKYAFRNYFGIFKTSRVRGPGGVMREFKELVDYRNLDKLKEFIAPHCTRLTKDECLDLPPKLYSTIKYQLAPAQRKAYADMEDEFITFLRSGEMVTAELALTRMLRLQQIASGYLPTPDGEEPYEAVCDDNPKIDTIVDLCEDIPHSTIIWCRFKRTIDLLCTSLGKEAVRYDGTVTNEDEAAGIVSDFQAGKFKYFISNAKKGGEGLTLHTARTELYAENTYNLAERLQSEDRCISERQEIMTQEGWKQASKIQIGDKVVSQDGLLHTVIDVWSILAKGRKAVIQDTWVRGWPYPIETTTDHQLLTPSGWREAGELNPGDHLQLPLPVVGVTKKELIVTDKDRVQKDFIVPAMVRNDPRGPRPWKAHTQKNVRLISLPKAIPLTKEAMFVFGYYIGDGWVGDKRQLNFAGHVKQKATFLATCKEWLSSFGINSKIFSRADSLGVTLTAYSKELATFFSNHFGAKLEVKHLPDWLWNTSLFQRNAFLAGWQAADGYTRPSRSGEPRFEIITVSRRLMADAVRLISGIGQRPCVNIGSKKQFSISWTEGMSHDLVITRIEKHLPNHQERVYDLTVEDSASFQIGPVIAHNCHRIGQKFPVQYIDVVAEDTVEEDVAACLQKKLDVASLVTGDKILTRWTL